MIEINKENIIFLKDSEIHSILYDFDFKIGCTKKHIEKTSNIKHDKTYSINLLWLNNKKTINNCIIFKHKLKYEIIGLDQQKEEEYANIIEKNLLQNITIFEYDNYNFNLITNKIKKIDNSAEYKIYVENFTENLQNWSRKNPFGKINLWYDSELIEINTLIETILFIDQFNITQENSFGIYVKYIRNLISLQRIITQDNPFKQSNNYIFNKHLSSQIEKRYEPYKTYINPFDKLQMENEKIYLPLYFRIDIAKMFIALDELKQNDYCVYTDFDIKPQDENFIFSFNKRKKNLDIFGFISSELDDNYENGFFIIGSKYKLLKCYIYNQILENIIKKSIRILPLIITGFENSSSYGRIQPIFRQKFHGKENINISLNNHQDYVYLNYRDWFTDIINDSEKREVYIKSYIDKLKDYILKDMTEDELNKIIISDKRKTLVIDINGLTKKSRFV